ncbi:MAG: FprA family A-type flavoprotein [Christensenella sp.]|nr:MAG: FprA family A-type flavoprotein [Christensenella sp.]
MKITNDISYVGVNDHKVDLFEGMYVVPNGMSYNSYVVLDDKIAVFDSVDAHFGDEWLANVESVLGGKTPDYLVVQHMEPDHSANIVKFIDKYPTATVVSSQKAFQMMKNYFGTEFADRRLVVSDGSVLETGKHVFKFVTAPMVHWPEVVMTYDETDKVLFSADAFGKFGALDVTDEDWACEARRYYFGIVGKYGVQVQNLFKKLQGLDIKIICALHGPVLTDNLGYYLNLYNVWSSYSAETDGVFIAYASVYGHTEKAAKLLAAKLEEKGVKVVISDLARSDWAENVEDAFRFSKLVLACPTYNGDAFPAMREFIAKLVERNYQSRKIAFIENGTWAPMSAKVMKGMFEGAKNIEFVEPSVKILSAMTAQNEQEIENLAVELAK